MSSLRLGSLSQLTAYVRQVGGSFKAPANVSNTGTKAEISNPLNQKPRHPWVAPVAMAVFGAAGVGALYLNRHHFSHLLFSPNGTDVSNTSTTKTSESPTSFVSHTDDNGEDVNDDEMINLDDAKFDDTNKDPTPSPARDDIEINKNTLEKSPTPVTTKTPIMESLYNLYEKQKNDSQIFADFKPVMGNLSKDSFTSWNNSALLREAGKQFAFQHPYFVGLACFVTLFALKRCFCRPCCKTSTPDAKQLQEAQHRQLLLSMKPSNVTDDVAKRLLDAPTLKKGANVSEPDQTLLDNALILFGNQEIKVVLNTHEVELRFIVVQSFKEACQPDCDMSKLKDHLDMLLKGLADDSITVDSAHKPLMLNVLEWASTIAKRKLPPELQSDDADDKKLGDDDKKQPLVDRSASIMSSSRSAASKAFSQADVSSALASSSTFTDKGRRCPCPKLLSSITSLVPFGHAADDEEDEFAVHAVVTREQIAAASGDENKVLKLFQEDYNKKFERTLRADIYINGTDGDLKSGTRPARLLKILQKETLTDKGQIDTAKNDIERIHKKILTLMRNAYRRIDGFGPLENRIVKWPLSTSA